MSVIEQAARAVRIHTALPDNTLALSDLSGEEQLSELFRYSVECVSENAALDLYEVLGMPIGIEFDTADDGIRHINGLVSEAAHVGSRGEYALYRLTMTAWPWMLTRTSDCRIFANSSVPDIIESVLQESGFDAVDNRLMNSYDPWCFCVQYKETDFNFISRLMEHEGIYYFFEHFENQHVLVLCDGSTAHATASNYAEIPHYPDSAEQSRKTENLVNWQFRKKVRSGKYATKDFAFDEPKRDLLVHNFSAAAGQYEGKEIYDYPGGYPYQDSGEMTRDYGERLARARMEALSAKHEVAMADGNVRGLAAGNLFTLTNCERDDQNREYLVMSASLRIRMDSYYSGAGGGPVELQSSFRCIPSNVPYRPQLKTPKPEIKGPQTAIVVGPAGEEIWTDRHGRVKLQFHWDRYGESDENSSCWVRVSQAWAGEKWGSIHIPRIGQEVIVEYIDGDPDRPIVTGRVYNGDRPVPYELPANATQSGIKSRSSKAGKPANFNEIRMEDKKGSEEIYIHAEKDQINIVENDEFNGVGHDRQEEVGNDETINIGKNKSISVGANHTETVQANFDLSVGASKSESVGASSSETVAVAKSLAIGAAYQISIGAAMNTTVGGALAEEVGGLKTEVVGAAKSVSVVGTLSQDIGGSASSSIGGDASEMIGGKYSVTVVKEHTLKARKFRLEAEEEVVIKAGKAQITMKSNGDIEISGANVSVKGTKKIDVKATKDVTIKGSKVKQN